MPYERLRREGRIQEHEFTQRDLQGFVRMAQRNVRDAGLRELSDDNRFALAYEAAMIAGKAVMAAEGYRTTSKPGSHHALFEFLEEVESGRWAEEAREFDDARTKRNEASYESFGVVSETEAHDLTASARAFIAEVEGRLKDRGLLPQT